MSITLAQYLKNNPNDQSLVGKYFIYKDGSQYVGEITSVVEDHRIEIKWYKISEDDDYSDLELNNKKYIFSHAVGPSSSQQCHEHYIVEPEKEIINMIVPAGMKNFILNSDLIKELEKLGILLK
jgi:hypothetical protein